MELSVIEDLMQLAPADRCRWSAPSTRLCERGVSVEWLRRSMNKVWHYLRGEVEAQWAMYRGAELRFSENPMAKPTLKDDMSPANIVPLLVKPLTRELRAPLFARVPAEFRAPPDQFISHSWRQPLVGGYGTLENLGGSAWIDVICYNQHEVEAVAADMRTVIAATGALTLPLGNTVEPLTRSWCLWELVCAHLEDVTVHVEEMLTAVTDVGMNWYHFERGFTSICDSQTTLREDHEQIIEAFVSTFGSIAASDRFVRETVKCSLRKPSFLT
jgi:hypothetical protein